MYKVVFDADGLIKLAKSGLLEKITKLIKCTMPEDVYIEVVERGKEKFTKMHILPTALSMQVK